MRFFIFVFSFLFLAFPRDGFAEVGIYNAIAFATSEQQRNGAVFVRLENTFDLDEYVVSASSPVAERVELHTHSQEDGVMQMRPVDYFVIPAHDSKTLKPMGDHIMLMGLNKQLQSGGTFPLTLNFEISEPITFTVHVVTPGDVEAMEGHSDHHGHDHHHH